jgi:hypothetical protein
MLGTPVCKYACKKRGNLTRVHPLLGVIAAGYICRARRAQAKRWGHAYNRVPGAALSAYRNM